MINIGILFSDFGPYHIARIEALSISLSKSGMNLIAFRITDLSETYSWSPETSNLVKVVTLAKRKPYILKEKLLVASCFLRELRKNSIKAVFLPSYSPLVNYLCFISAKYMGCKTIMMNESWEATSKSSGIASLIKKQAVRNFDAALVGGTPQLEYVNKLGMPKEKIFIGYDIVDNDYYIKQAEKWRFVELEEIPIRGLPSRFFLNIGRFVSKKNLIQLVTAFCNTIDKFHNVEISLVLVGEGDMEVSLRDYARLRNVKIRNGSTDFISNPREIVFYPFQQLTITPIFFSRCEAFILPSKFEEWGLVVNEAILSSVPVLVSNKVGSSFDLVEEGVNGYTFNPNIQEELDKLLELFILNPNLKSELSKESLKIMKQWGPDRFGNEGLKALNLVLNKN